MVSCTTAPKGPAVKVYISVPESGCAFRLQDNECVPYGDTEGWFMMTGADFQNLIEYSLTKE